MRILVVEDEPNTGDYLRKGLTESGFIVDLARTADTLLAIGDSVIPAITIRNARGDLLGRTSVTWDAEPDSYPEVAASAEGIVSHVLARVRPGSIVLLHPWYRSRATSLAAVPLLIDSLHARGYRVTTVGELLARRDADR